MSRQQNYGRPDTSRRPPPYSGEDKDLLIRKLRGEIRELKADKADAEPHYNECLRLSRFNGQLEDARDRADRLKERADGQRHSLKQELAAAHGDIALYRRHDSEQRKIICSGQQEIAQLTASLVEARAAARGVQPPGGELRLRTKLADIQAREETVDRILINKANEVAAAKRWARDEEARLAIVAANQRATDHRLTDEHLANIAERDCLETRVRRLKESEDLVAARVDLLNQREKLLNEREKAIWEEEERDSDAVSIKDEPETSFDYET
jgi:hypothetical protein